MTHGVHAGLRWIFEQMVQGRFDVFVNAFAKDSWYNHENQYLHREQPVASVGVARAFIADMAEQWLSEVDERSLSEWQSAIVAVGNSVPQATQCVQAVWLLNGKVAGQPVSRTISCYVWFNSESEIVHMATCQIL